MKPGHHPNLSNADYHAADGISSSNLKLLYESELHLKHKELFWSESDAFNFGSLVHCLALEPDNFANEFIVMPKLDGRTNAGKADKAAWMESATGKMLVTDEDIQRASRMVKNVQTIAGNLLSHGVKEQSYFAMDGDLLIKCRPDNYIQSAGIVVDLKTISSRNGREMSDWDIKRAVKDYRYDWSAVWYPKVLNLLGLPAKKFVFVFVDTASPHNVRIRELPYAVLEAAFSDIEMMLDKYRAFLATGKANVIKELFYYNEE